MKGREGGRSVRIILHKRQEKTGLVCKLAVTLRENVIEILFICTRKIIKFLKKNDKIILNGKEKIEFSLSKHLKVYSGIGVVVPLILNIGSG